MTICVAAICDGDTILGATDNMITAGDIQFEPPALKMTSLTNSIVVMTAGDSTLHAEILDVVRVEVSERIEFEPEEWLKVKDVAELYVETYNKVRQKCAERAILAPLGLTFETFVTRQAEMLPDFVRQIGTELINYNAGDIEAIITGLDEHGPHIWVAKNEDLRCYDKAGFAAIGSGEWHAKSSFMFSRHMSLRELPQTLLLTYAAKKRAEVAPGVGGVTDMFIVGPKLGSFTLIGGHILERLEEIYRQIRQDEQQILQRANEEVEQYVEEILGAATPKGQEALPEDGGGGTPTDQKQLRNGSEEGEPEGEGGEPSTV
ncbi:MAG: hypothetical protein WCD76_06035 [Pyrinomonadaceae bacterium]